MAHVMRMFRVWWPCDGSFASRRLADMLNRRT